MCFLKERALTRRLLELSLLSKGERIMDFLADNWFYIVALILFVAMHLIGSGCGHAHGERRQRNNKASNEVAPGTKSVAGYNTSQCAK